MYTVEEIGRVASALERNIRRVVQGKDEQVRLAVVALLAEGHLLIEDVPGVGKTMVARALAQSVDADFKRIQFTPDLLPSDVTGGSMWHQDRHEFEFHPGPVFANIVLADEINRASPKTQSALLEVMEERTHSADGRRYPMPRPFMVVATQNPVGMDAGTYRLPEAQLDRFLIQMSMEYPDEQTELRVVVAESVGATIDALSHVAKVEEVAAAVEGVGQVYATEGIQAYAVRLARATRIHQHTQHGVSPRGAIALVRASRALAACKGSAFVTPEDVKWLAPYVFNHRIILKAQAAGQQVSPANVVDDVLASVAPPRSRE